MVGSPAENRTRNGTDASTTPLPDRSPVSRPPSPIWQARPDMARFPEELTMRLNALQYRIESQFDMYGEAAYKHPPGHTPPEVREESQRRCEALLEEIMDRSTSPDDSEDDRAIASWRKANRELLKSVRAAMGEKKTRRRDAAAFSAEAVKPPPSKRRKTARTAGPLLNAPAGPGRSARVAAAKATLLGPRRSARLAARSAHADGRLCLE